MIAHSTPFPLIANCMTRSRGYFLAVGSTLLDPAALIDSLPVWPVRKYLYGNVIQIISHSRDSSNETDEHYYIPISF